jgi:tRNA 2-selenouridine synthase
MQPSNEQFENNLFEHWRSLNPKKPVWLEDESKTIGSVFIPDEIFSQMRISPVVKVDLEITLRVKRLEKEYANFPSERLKKSIEKIRKRLGDENQRIALTAIDQSDFAKAIELSLAYYDKSYSYGLSGRDDQSIHSLQLTRNNASENARKVLHYAIQRNLI